MVDIHFEDIEILDVSPEFFGLWLSKVCQKEDKSLGDLAVIFCSDEYLLGMNNEYLKHDFYTDIVSFDYCEGDVVSGDLFISVDRVKENASDFGEMFHVELNRVVVHGVLHLLGYSDKNEDDKLLMTRMEDESLRLIVSRET